MKKILFLLPLISIGYASASSNMSCVKSVKKALEFNQAYYNDHKPVEGTEPQQQQQQQQQSTSLFDDATTFQLLRSLYLDARVALREIGRFSRSQNNVEYLTKLLKITEGNYTKADVRRLLGSSNMLKLQNYINAGESFCISEDRVSKVYSDLDYVKYRNNDLFKYVYTSGDDIDNQTLIDLIIDVNEDEYKALERFEKLMPGSSLSKDYGAQYIKKENHDDSNPIRVMTKTELRRLVSRH